MDQREFEMRRRQVQIREQEMLRQHGWFQRFVFPTEEPAPGEYAMSNGYTVGIEESFKHPNFQIVSPFHPNLVHGIFFTLVERLKEGMTFEHEMVSDQILEGMDVEFMKVTNSRGEYLRVLIPDEKGLLPNDPLCNPVFKAQLNALDPSME